MDYYYDDEDEDDESCPCPDGFISTYTKSPNGTVPENILEFYHSFGYNSKRLFNLVLIEPDVLVFASGNLLTILRISTKEATFRRSANGGGIGFLTKNPNPKYNYLTVAENGTEPKVIIYEFPKFKVIEVLENAAEHSFTCVAYNSTGELLATQAGEPDYMLTIWKWSTASIILKSQSFQNDVLNVIFSPYNPGQLTTCGLGHIKFWKMARTFTGLKLQGELGRFGKTEFSDIYAIYPLADEKVISGCEWGNMLLWDDGLIKLEVCRKGRKPCHDGPITYIEMSNGEVFTAGMDGYIRIWFWETVEIADPPEDDRFVEIEPLNEFRFGPEIGKACEIRHIVWRDSLNEKDLHCYVQDGFGGIWLCDVNIEGTPDPPKQIFRCHGGRVMGVSSSSFSPHFVTLGEAGKMHVYDYLRKELVLQKQFPAPGADVIWIPSTIDPSGSVIVLAFTDGVIRQVVFNTAINKGPLKENCYLIDVIKAHAAPITKLSINPKETVLVSGSEEKTIFVFSIKKTKPFFQIIPIGFVEVSSVPRSFNWKPDSYSTVLIGFSSGEVYEALLPIYPQSYTDASFRLEDINPLIFQFKSIKSEIRREILIAERDKKKLEKRNRKKEELDLLRLANPGIDIDEDAFLADSEEEEELEPLYYPKTPNPVLWLRYTPDSTIWLSMGGYDAGYIYECVMTSPESKVRATLITDGDDIEIHSYLEYDRYLIFGMQDGSVRINARKQDFRNLSDYWKISMHSNNNGVIPAIETSFDGKYLFTVGFDGCIFVYEWKEFSQRKPNSNIVPLLEPSKTVKDIEDSSFLSLEQQKIKREHDRRMKLANDRKQKVLDILSDYKNHFKDILKKNKLMAPSQKLTAKELELDGRITADLRKTLDDELQLMRRKLSFDVEKSALGRKKVVDYFIKPLEYLPFEVPAIRKNISVKSFKIMRLDDSFYKAKLECDRKIEARTAAAALAAYHEPAVILDPKRDSTLSEQIELPDFEKKALMGLKRAELPMNLNPKMKRLLDKYRKRQEDKFMRNTVWVNLNAERPDPNKNSDADNRDIAEAERSIGDYKLKINPEYEPPESENTLLKYKQLLNLREELHQIRMDFNNRIFKLRSDKEELYNFISVQKQRLAFIQHDIPPENRQNIPEIPELNLVEQYPDLNLKPNVEITNTKEVQELLFEASDVQAVVESESHISQYEQILVKLAAHVLKWDINTKLPPFSEICDEIDLLPKLTENKTAILDLMSHSKTTPWEIELRYNVIINKIIEQQKIVAEIEERISNFDLQIEELSKSQLKVEIDAKFLEERIMSMNQELVILRDCERLEQSIIGEVQTALQQRKHYIQVTNGLKTALDDNSKKIEKMEDQVKSIQNTFLSQIKGNKFYDFLRRIFKKKFKPPKEVSPDDSDESSESESSTSEEEEQGSGDSLDMAPIRLDENILPPGCDKTLYDLAFALRADRHNLEQTIHMLMKQIDDLNKKLGDIAKHQADANILFHEKKKKLLDFRRERQKELNKIDVLVVLRLDQLQHIKEGTNIGDINNTLLFNSNSVLKLYTRVGQLGLETLATKRLHRINIVHLQRMTTDCKYMNKQITLLQVEVQEMMYKKFGMIVNLDELEESILRKYVFEIRSEVKDEQKTFNKAMALKKKTLAKAEEELIKVTQVGTEKLNILTVLQEEENFLLEILRHQAKLYDKKATDKHIDLKRDLNKLNDICLRQQQQIEFLEKEIRTLRLRTKPLQQPTKMEQDAAEFVEILPTNERLYEETMYTVLTSQPPTHGVNPDSTTSKKVLQVVQRFLVKIVGSKIPEETIRKYSKKISTYLAFVANNFETDQGDTVIECIVDNFQAIIPQKYLILIKPDDIKTLFNEVLDVFELEKVEVNTKDVLNGIVANSLEMWIGTQMENISQEVVTEIFKEIIEVLPMEDLAKPDNIETIIDNLKSVPEIHPKCIDIENLMERVVNHALENLLDEFDMRTVRHAAEQIIEKFVRLRSRPEKPME